MHIPKMRKIYFDLHGNTKWFDEMLVKRKAEYIEEATKRTNITREEAEKILDHLDKLDEELDI